MKTTTMENAIKIQGLEYLTVISPWERYEDFGKVWKERRPLTIEYLGDVSICMQDVDFTRSRCHDEGLSQKVTFLFDVHF